MNRRYLWARLGNGYEVSSRGDKRFSAFNAIMPDGRSIEMHYQCDTKGYDPGGQNWQLGKRKPPLNDMTSAQLYEAYKALWEVWADAHPDLIKELARLAASNNYTLTDCFASTAINQAHALVDILNDFQDATVIV